MTNSKNTKKALLGSLLSLVICVSMLIGTTFAWFTDSVTNSNNIVKSGTLDVEMFWKDATASGAQQTYKDASEGAMFNYNKWEPGYVEAKNIKINNAGTLALKYILNIVANGQVSKLADVIDVYYANSELTLASRDLSAMTKVGTLNQVISGALPSVSGDLTAGETDFITVALKMQETAGNDYQNLAIGTDFSIKLFATQLASEKDSFGNDYDKYAPMQWNGKTAAVTPVGTVYEINTPEELAWIAEQVNGGNTFSGKTVKLMRDIDLGNKNWTPIGTNADAVYFAGTFDGGNNTVYNLYVNQGAGYHAAGLFGAIRGTVKNLTVDGAKITNISSGAATDNGTAVVVGSSYGNKNSLIDKVTVNNATVNGNRYVAGIVGYMDGTVTNCTVESSEITATPDNLAGSYDNGDKVGGIVGYMNSDSVKVSDNTVSDTTVTGYRDIGGIVGCANNAAFVTNNTIGNNVTLVQDGTNGLSGTVTTVGSIVGRNNADSNKPVDDGKANITRKVAVSNATQLNSAISRGAGEIVLAAGTYTMPAAAQGKEFTISGTKDTVISVETVDTNAGGANVTFDGVTVQGQTSGNYAGYGNGANVNFVDCTINGKISLYGEKASFINCTFNNNNDYSVWTWGGKDVEFIGCTFNSGGKALLIYGEYVQTNIDIIDCVFNDNDTLTTDKAAIEIGSDRATDAHNINIENVTVNGFAPGKNTGSNIWANKNSMGKDRLNVVIDGVDVY